MNASPFAQAGMFIVELAFGFYILALMLRFLLQWARADFYNPLVQFLVQITNPVLIPLRKFIPGFMGLDMSAVLVMVVLKAIELFLLISISGHSVNFFLLLPLAVGQIFGLMINVFFFAIIIRALMSWINPDPRQPVVILLHQLTEPLLAPARRIIPPVSGLDLSPLAVLVLLQLTRILVVTPLQGMLTG